MFPHKTGSGIPPVPYRVTADGDIDVQLRLIKHLGDPYHYLDAVNLQSCLRLIRAHTEDYELLRIDEECDDRAYDTAGARLINVADPVQDTDAVTLGYLNKALDERLGPREAKAAAAAAPPEPITMEDIAGMDIETKRKLPADVVANAMFEVASDSEDEDKGPSAEQAAAAAAAAPPDRGDSGVEMDLLEEVVVDPAADKKDDSDAGGPDASI